MLKELIVNGREYINVPADEKSLEELGLSKNEIDEILSKHRTEVVKENFRKELESYIYTNYPKDKQSQDIMWTNYHRTNLVAKGVTDVEAKVVAMVLEVQQGKKLSTVLKDVTGEQKPAFEKLVKVGLRTAWAESCIEEGLKAMAEDREPNYPAFPEVQ